MLRARVRVTQRAERDAEAFGGRRLVVTSARARRRSHVRLRQPSGESLPRLGRSSVGSSSRSCKSATSISSPDNGSIPRGAGPLQLMAVIADLIAEPMSRMSQRELRRKIADGKDQGACLFSAPITGQQVGNTASTPPGVIDMNSSGRVDDAGFADSLIYRMLAAFGQYLLDIADLGESFAQIVAVATGPAMICAARPHEIPLLPQIERRCRRTLCPSSAYGESLTMPPASIASLEHGPERRQAVGRDVAPFEPRLSASPS